jgi:PAS domain S-box-containing protein
MSFQDLPIKRKVVSVIMLTSIVALLLTTVAFAIYDRLSYRQTILRNLATSAAIIADNSTAALMFQDDELAQVNLSALKADSHIVMAALYDHRNRLCARYPTNELVSAFPLNPSEAGQRSEGNYVNLFQPVIQGDKRVGTLFLKSDLSALSARLQLYGGIALGVLAGSLLVALIISSALQRRITAPILALAEVSRIASERGDYSIRAQKASGDELGFLTDAFNLMLARIEEQTVALRESEERLRLALEASLTGTWDWNLKSDKITWDNYTHKLFGLTPGSFSGTYEQLLGLVHPEDRPVVEAAVSRTLDRKGDFACDFRVVWPDGSVHNLASQGKALFSGDGRPIRMSGVTLDLSERKQAEEIRSFLAAIVDSSDDAIIGKDLNSRVVSWNAGAERMFGFSAAEMLGQSVTRLVSPEHPEEENRIVQRIKHDQTEHLETERIRKDGRPIAVSLTVSPIKNACGEIIGMSSIMRDITERQQAQQALEGHAAVLREQSQMLELANVLARDLQDRIILWNTGMEKMYGWSKAEALGKISHELFRTTFPEPLETIRAALFREGHWEGELTHVRKDGQTICVTSQWVLHTSAAGKPAAILEVNNDVTERKLAEQQVMRMNVELEHRVEERTTELMAANRELEAFTYSVAHDLRAPLRHIDAFTRILQEDFSQNLPPEARRFLDSIAGGSRNMSHLVDDMLNLARIGRQDLNRQPTPLGHLVQEVVADLKHESEGRTVEWRVQPLPTVQCDSGLMKQVFANLLSNALKYTRPRGVAVIEVGSLQNNGDTTVFVRDNGVGFNMKYADKLFGVFQRLHRSEEFEGTGVGLATVDRIIRKHGGAVWAEAAIDKGATFYFTVTNPEHPVETSAATN